MTGLRDSGTSLASGFGLTTVRNREDCPGEIPLADAEASCAVVCAFLSRGDVVNSRVDGIRQRRHVASCPSCLSQALDVVEQLLDGCMGMRMGMSAEALAATPHLTLTRRCH